MPFAWTAVYLMSVINQANTLDAEKEQQLQTDSLGKYCTVLNWYCCIAANHSIFIQLV